MRIIPENINNICIHTGNILNLNEVKKNVGQNSSDEERFRWSLWRDSDPGVKHWSHCEGFHAKCVDLGNVTDVLHNLVESLKTVMDKWIPQKENEGPILELMNTDESIKVSGVEGSELRTSVKIFIANDKKESLQEAIEKLFQSLEAQNIDSLVIVYTSNRNKPLEHLSQIHNLWEVLETYVQNGKVSRIGISDIDTELFIALYNAANTKPSIVQINLASCCVVPPVLQEFCKQNDIQLLTHNDPLEFLPSKQLHTAIGLSPDSSTFSYSWIVRYLTLKCCRGVIAAKGYIISIQRV